MKLNALQKKAVETLEGPVMVIAGPGTGKTQIIAARIAEILEKTDTPPYSILALTFTESAAANMRERVVQMIGKQGYYVNITTFHSFCEDIIKSNPDFFPIERGSEPLSDIEKYDLFERIIEGLELDVLKPINRQYYYVPDIISSISHLKREGVSPNDFRSIIDTEYASNQVDEAEVARLKHEKDKNKNLELHAIYEQYQKYLREKLRYDYEDMIALVVEAFRNDKLLLREYQEKIHYFLVDEYQDTNAAQNNVVKMLASYWGPDANIFVVGDPHQSIFRFQGASIENVLNFINDYPNSTLITLDTAYRSPQAIYSAAFQIIRNNTLTEGDISSAVNMLLKSDKKSSENAISVAELPSQTVENIFLSEKIKGLIDAGVEPEEIAVLYRKNSEATEIQEALDSNNILYEIDGGVNVLHNEEIRQLLVFLNLLNGIQSSSENENIFEVMSYEWTDIDSVLAFKIARAAGKAKMSIFDLVSSGFGTFLKYHTSGGVTPIEFEAATQFMDSLVSFANKDATMVFTEWFENVLRESGYIGWILRRRNKIELLTNLNSLFREIKLLVNQNHGLKLGAFLEIIDTMNSHRLSLFAEDLNIEKGAVHLSTVHKAKGREWKYVFLTRCIDKVWGNTRKRELIHLPKGLLKSTDVDKKERNEDDRRLFYVALTRAKKKFTMTYPKTIVTANRSKSVVRSMFIDEIPQEYLKIDETDAIMKNVESALVNMLEPSANPNILISEKSYFTELVKDFRISVTALNTYLRDVNEFVENVLLRVPRAKPPQMAFGTAVHYALEQMYKQIIEHKKPAKEYVLHKFEQSLTKELLEENEYHRRLEKGREYLSKYYDVNIDLPVEPVYIERFFGYGMKMTVLGDIQLTGRIDRIDWVDKDGSTVKVIDYKTGKPRSINDIEGKTVASMLSPREAELPDSVKGPYKRQLLFYKLLTQLDQTFKFEVVEGVFDFVQPDSQNKLVSRSFQLRKDDVNDLKALIREVSHEIRELKFLKDYSGSASQRNP